MNYLEDNQNTNTSNTTNSNPTDGTDNNIAAVVTVYPNSGQDTSSE